MVCHVHFGGLVGYSEEVIISLASSLGMEYGLPSGNSTSSLKSPPSQSVFSLPGMPHSHFFKSRVPVVVLAGLAKKPKG